MKKTGKVISDTPKGGNPPSGPKQSSGAVKHARMTTGTKVESESNLPKLQS